MCVCVCVFVCVLINSRGGGGVLLFRYECYHSGMSVFIQG